MASATALANKTAAENSYKLAIDSAERKRNPPGGGPVNPRQLDSALKKVKDKWTELEIVTINYLNRFNFPDEDARIAQREQWLTEIDTHDDWIEAVESILDQVNVANAPPSPPALTPDQSLDRVKANVANKEATLVSEVDNIATSLSDNTIRVTSNLLEQLSGRCDQMMTELTVDLANIYVTRETADPVNWRQHNTSAHNFTADLRIRIQDLKLQIAEKAPANSVATSGGGASVAGSALTSTTSYKEYKRDDLPTYKGDIRGYPIFKREWQTGNTWEVCGLASSEPSQENT